MNIFVNARFLTQPLSGVQRYAIECSRQIKKLQPDVTFLAPKNILHRDIADELGVVQMGFNTGHKWEQIDLPLYLTGRKSPALLNLANTAPMFYSNSYVTIHDLAFYHHPEWNSRKFSSWYNILIPRIALSARHVFTVSQTIKEELLKYYKLPSAKVSVTYNGISKSMLATSPPAPEAKEKIILSVGTFNIRKNHHRLIQAYLKSQVKEVYQLIIIGDKNRVFKEAGIDEDIIAESNVKILETIDEEGLIDLYRRAEVVASLSLYEGFGIPLLEGLYNNCKILCSDIPVYHELYDRVADFCDAINFENVSNSLNSIVNSFPTSRNKINELLSKFSYSESANRILQTVSARK